MEIAKMLNVTILACLLILTGCFGLGTTDDVIDDANGQQTGTPQQSFYQLTTSDHSDMIEDRQAMMTLAFTGDQILDWATIQIEIIIDAVPFTCDNPGATGGNCGVAQHGGGDSNAWEQGEILVVSDTGGAFCMEDCDLMVRVKVQGDTIMMGSTFMR
jgi:hypothetical protein